MSEGLENSIRRRTPLSAAHWFSAVEPADLYRELDAEVDTEALVEACKEPIAWLP